ncbi:solute carrier organic anion transporter family member 2A1-like [Octopus vulgaris]|uniref:Solute carrier organic anion transporter family member n=1 Tax=Octopus vulgaris TaxID=6645 RepID=A0AA36BUA5_OCTVU|nr:solute carrier organic anion transporter family member 2A1-like [Octopus vulgaris]
MESNLHENGLKRQDHEEVKLHNMKPVDSNLNDNNSEKIYERDNLFADAHHEQEQQQTLMNTDMKSMEADDDTNGENTCCFIWKYITFNRGLNIATFTILGALTNFMTYSVPSYISSQVSSLEKQFGLSSAEFGFINSANDIGFLLVVLLASHFGRDAHIPKLFSVLTLFVGVTVGCMSLTYLLRPISYLELLENSASLNGTIGNNSVNVTAATANIYLCSDGKSRIVEEANCASNQVKSHSAYFLFVFFMIALGICKGPRSSLFPTYIDNNVPEKHHSAIFIGLMIAFLILGNAFIFVLGGIISRIPADLDGKGMTPSDPNWIGAWWIGFLFIAAITILFGFPLMFYPREIPKQKQPKSRPGNLDSAVLRLVKETTENHKTEETGKTSFIEKLKDLPSSLKGLLTNPIYVLLLVGDCILVFCFGGLRSFLQKYLEHQFFLPVWESNYILAIVGLLGSLVGIMLGCIIITRLRLEKRGMISMKLIAYGICIVLEIVASCLSCEAPLIINNPMNNISLNSNMSALVDDCNCDIRQYFPVCGYDQQNYFSPCHAGCMEGNNLKFTNCKGIPGMSATAGLCPIDCGAKYLFIVLTTIIGIVGMASVPPGYLLVVRTPSEKDKALGIGFYSMILSAGGFLPAPVVFGRAIDLVCILWDMKCNERGACKLYDLDSLRGVIFFPMIFGRFISFLAFILVFYLHNGKQKKT